MSDRMFDPPQNLNEAKAQLKANRTAIVEVAKTATARFYEAGMLCSYVKNKIGHGNFLSWIEENVGYRERTAQRYMRYFEACDAAGKLLLYKNNRSKTDTLSLLPPPDEEGENVERPRHEPGHSPLWNATAAARALQKHLDHVTDRRSLDDFDEVVAAFHDLAQESRERKAESRRKIRNVTEY